MVPCGTVSIKLSCSQTSPVQTKAGKTILKVRLVLWLCPAVRRAFLTSQKSEGILWSRLRIYTGCVLLNPSLSMPCQLPLEINRYDPAAYTAILRMCIIFLTWRHECASRQLRARNFFLLSEEQQIWFGAPGAFSTQRRDLWHSPWTLFTINYSEIKPSRVYNAAPVFSISRSNNPTPERKIRSGGIKFNNWWRRGKVAFFKW